VQSFFPSPQNWQKWSKHRPLKDGPLNDGTLEDVLIGPLEDGQIQFDLEQCGCKRKLNNVQNNPPGLLLNKTTCGLDAFRRGPGQKIVGFVFYGDINSNQG
jgi:hypothetical protein